MEWHPLTTDLKYKETAVTIGKFDAIHRGHRLLIDDIVRRKADGMRAVLMTFAAGREPLLFSDAERCETLSRLGVDTVIELSLDAIGGYTAEEFIQKVVVEQLDVRHLVCGSDFRFGFERRGDTAMLEDFGRALRFSVHIYEQLQYKAENISSSRIKEAFYRGEIEDVNAMLGYPVFITGTVIKGHQLGRTIGIPTANLAWPTDKMMPPKGVYAARVVHGQRQFDGVANIGVKPTVSDDEQPLIEVNIFDFTGDIYGEVIRVELFHMIRPEQKFNSIRALSDRLYRDVSLSKEFFQTLQR
ncbi:MAG: riboflavin biosynthesis protein RibF [Eubacteriales bacterium]|nr:riboflavin biosynthesis protein RibF [Eubacteriales bacterium]